MYSDDEADLIVSTRSVRFRRIVAMGLFVASPIATTGLLATTSPLAFAEPIEVSRQMKPIGKMALASMRRSDQATPLVHFYFHYDRT